MPSIPTLGKQRQHDVSEANLVHILSTNQDYTQRDPVLTETKQHTYKCRKEKKEKEKQKSDMVVHVCNPRALEAEAGPCKFKAILGYATRIYFKQQ